MSVAEIRKRIGTVELALNETGPTEALNAIIDTLKEIAKTLETLEKNQ